MHQCRHFSRLSYSPIGGKRYMLQMPLVYFNPRGRTYVVPRKFITDFASIPRIFQGIIAKRGKYDAPAVLHDFMYRSGIVSKREADKIFRLSMKDCEVKVWKYWCMWAAVSVGGIYSWHKYRHDNKKKRTIKVNRRVK